MTNKKTMTMTKKTLVLLLFLLTAMGVAAQQNMTFRHLDARNGLSNNSVRSFIRERNGLLWIGTAYGLNRYDGYHFKRYTLKTAGGAVCQDIWGIQKDCSDNILVCANGVYFKYDRRLNTFAELNEYLKKEGVSVQGNIRVLLTEDGDYWIFSERGALFFNSKTRKTVNVTTGGELPESLASYGSMAYSTLRDNYIYVSSPKSRRWTHMAMPTGVFPLNSTKRVFIDSRGGLWVSCYSSNNILHKPRNDDKWRTYTIASAKNSSGAEGINELCEDGNGLILVASDHIGLFFLNPLDGTATHVMARQGDSGSLAANNISAIYVDSQNTIWAGHNKVGLSYSNASFGFVRFHQFSGFSDVYSIYRDSRQQLWLGTDGQGLYRWNIGTNPIKLPLPDKAYIAINSDAQSRIWASAYNGGIYVLRNNTVQKVITPANSGLKSASNWGLLNDGRGYFWVYSSDGVQRININTLDITDVRFPDGRPIITFHITYDGIGNMYVGSTDGIVKINTATLHQQVIRGNKAGTREFLEKSVTQVCISHDDILWVGSNNGLSVYDTALDSILYLTDKNGLSSNSIRAIGEAANHDMIVTTSNGLSIISYSRDGNGILHLSCRTLTANDGVGNSYFNNFALCNVDSSVFCGNADGITEIDETQSNTAPNMLDSIYLDAVSVGNKPLPCGKKIYIDHNSEQLKLEFSTPDIIGAHNIRFSFMIEERDKDWQALSDNTLSLAGLSHGTYTLHVRATNRYGQLTNKELILTIVVRPPFYLTWWAYTFYILAVSVLVWWNIRRLKRRQTMQLENDRNRMAYENQQKADKMKIDFFVSLSHDLRTPLTLILTPLQMLRKQRLPEAIGKKLDVMEENANRLNEMITSIMDYRKVEAGDTLNMSTSDLPVLIREVTHNFERQAKYGNKAFAVDCEPPKLLFSFDRPKMKRILENLLSNAVKYTRNGDSIGLTMRLRGNNVEICVYDTGIGIKDEDKQNIFKLFYRTKEAQQKSGTGIGLYLVSNYVQMHGGNITVRDHEPHGTEFTVSIPLRGTGSAVEERPDSVTDVEQAIEQEQDLVDEDVSAKTNLLIVDDNKQICELLAEELSDAYNVVSAFDGEQALRLLYSNNIDIVVTDIAMPVMDGIELCKNIKEDINISHIPVIMLTAKITDNEKLEGLTAGADEYLCKPVNIDMLRLRIEKIMEWKANSQRLFNKSIKIEPAAITITHIDEEFVKKAIEVVEQHMGDSEFSVEQLGCEMSMSRSHLYKKMMAIIGRSPNDFIHTLRMKRARQLLEQSGMNVSEVAYAVGFSSPRRFTICFKKEFGDIPSAFMCKNSGNNDV